MNILISACLLGQYCRYDGKTKVYPQVQALLNRDDIHLIPVCPEQAGGLATPRPAAERQGKRVVTANGSEVRPSTNAVPKRPCIGHACSTVRKPS